MNFWGRQTEEKKVEEAKSVVVEQVKNILKMEHKVTFGQSAAWINTKNIVLQKSTYIKIT